MIVSRFVNTASLRDVAFRVIKPAIVLLVSVTVLFAALAIAQEPVPAPPQVYIDTTWRPPTGGTWQVNSNSTLQLALNLSQPGDTIILDNRTVYTSNFTLPVKSNPNHLWIYIESSGLSSLPPAGSRVGPADAANMAKIMTPNVSPTFSMLPGANHYRLVGLELTTNSTQGGNQNNTPPSNNFTWSLLNGPTGVGMALPDSITVDRCYIHGSATQDVGSGVQANGTNFAVIDSYISDIHLATSDSQAVLAYWTPGPLKVVNNYLSATTEDMMVGGAGGYNNPYVPSDIEIRGNHFFKPLAWDSCGVHGTVPAGGLLANGTRCPSSPPNQWVEKNNLEFKSAQRVVVTGNVMENTWVSGQTGASVLFTIRTTQSGNIAVVDDIDLQNNLLTNVDQGINTLEQDDQCSAAHGYPNCTNPGESRRVKIYDNLLLLRPSSDTNQHSAITIDGGNSVDVGLTDYVFQHNTLLMSDQSTLWRGISFNLPQLTWGCSPPQGFSSTHNVWVLDNAVTQQPDGDCGFVSLFGPTGLAYYMGDPSPMTPRFYGNAIFAPGRAYSYPANNDVTTTPFTYMNPAGGNYQLLVPDWTNTTDGKVSGVDWATVQQQSSITLIAAENNLYSNQTTPLTATVSGSGSGGSPTGTVSFMLGTTLLGTGTLVMVDGADAAASIQLKGSQLSLGPNSITAVYSGDSNYSASTSSPITVTLLTSDDGFGTVSVGTAAPVQALTYTFGSTARLTAINILTMGSSGLDYRDGGSSTCTVGTQYTAGQSCTVTVGFTPLAPGLRPGAVTLFMQGSNLPLMTWYLSGTGESAAVSIDPGTQTTLGTIATAATYGSAVDGAGNVYVADKANGQVVKIAVNTQVLTVVVNRLSSPTSVALDGAGNLYIAQSTGVLAVPNENGTLNASDKVTIPITGLGLAQGIAEDANANLYVADSTHGTVLEVSAAGGAPATLASGLTNPHAVAVDAAGNVYVAADNLVNEYPAGGGAAISVGTGYASPQGVAVDASGTVYVADTGNAQLVKVLPEGEGQSVLTVAGLTAPEGVTVDATGNLYVSDGNNVYELNRVQPAALNFGNVQVGNTSPPQTVQVSNIGNQLLSAGALTISANYTQQPSGGTDCSSSTQMSAAGVCAIAVVFSPTTTGVLNGTVALSDNALNNPSSQQQVSLTGTGIPTQKQQQTITFPNPGPQTYGAAPITLTATASSGLPVTYTLISGPATLSGNVLTITGAGSVTVEANQAGNSQWLPAPPVDDTFTANPAVLTVTANNAAMTYGGTLPTFTASYSGFVNGDGQGVLSGSPSLTTTATSSSPTGNYTITAAQGTLAAQNYTFTFVNGTLTINPTALTVTADNASMTYGGTVPTFTASYSGFVNGDGQGVLTGSPSLTTTATSSSPTGNYTITAGQGTLAAQNYTFTFVNGSLTINPAVLTVTANNAVMTYGGTLPTFTATYSGFVNGDGQGVLSGSPSLTTTATSSSPAGSYPITASQGTLSARNYTFTFVNGVLTINQAVLTVTANNASMPEGGQLPTLTASYSGFVNGDGQGVLSGSPSLTTTATNQSPPGNYPIIAAQGTLSAQNYSFTFVNGVFTVTPVTAVITAPAKGSTFIGSRATFTWSHQSGASNYILYIGSSPGAYDIDAVHTSNLTTSVSNLPTDGRQIYVTLFGDGTGRFTQQDTATYTAATIVKAAITAPAKGSTLSSNRVTFTWTAETGASNYILYIGSSPGAYDIDSVHTSSLTATVSNVPTDGRQIYVTLFGDGGGTMTQQDTATYAAASKAAITAPAKGSTLSGNHVTFTWSAETGASNYILYIGSSPGTYDIDSVHTSSLTATVSNVPTDGRQIYVTLFGDGGGTMTQQDTATYTAANIVKAAITAPAKGSTLSGNHVTFTWSAETGASNYILYIGSSPGTYDIDSVHTSNLATTVSNVPTDGRQIYVTLFGDGGGTMTQQDTATYTAANIVKAAITAPAKGSTLSGNKVTFTWTAETGASNYILYIGSSPGTYDIDSVHTSSLTATVSNVPTDGRQIYVTLFGDGGGTMTQQDTATYTAANIVKAVITAPAKGSTLTGRSATFTWTAETGASNYILYIGSSSGAHDIDSVHTSNLSATVNNLPTDGRQLYVTLYGDGGGGGFTVQDTATYTAASQ